MSHDPSQISVTSLAQLGREGTWRLTTLHHRNTHLFVWITRGQGRAILHGLRRGFSAHYGIFIPAGSLSALDLGRQTLGQAVIIPPEISAQFPDSPQIVKVTDGTDQLDLTSLLDGMRREQERTRIMQQDIMQAQVSLLAVWLRRQMAEAPPPLRSTAAERLVSQFCDLVSRRYKENLPMADYAEMLDITPTHLTRVCKKCTGLTASDVLTDCIRFDAQDHLMHGEQPVNEIAKELGFRSAAYFTRFIQQHCGQSPSAVRRSGVGALRAHP